MRRYDISYCRVPQADIALQLCYSMAIGLISLVAAYLIKWCMFQPLCYVTVGTFSQLGIVSPIGNVALRVLVLGSE